MRKNLIINEKRRAGYNPAFIEISEFEAVDINTEEDLDYARAMFNYINESDT